MIKYDSKYKLAWDGCILALAILNSFLIPFSLAFTPPFSETNGMDAFSKIVDAIFMIDIILNFRTTILSKKTGEEIKDPKQIAINYISHANFWLDLLSSLPLEKVGKGNFMSIIGLFKIFRVTRLATII